MACEAEGRSATLVPVPADPANGANAGDVNPSGAVETCEERERRLRSNSEETALILTSMMSMGAFGGATHPTQPNNSDDDDMGEDMSGDEHDDADNSDRKPAGHGADSGSLTQRLRNESNRVKSLVTKHISIDELREHFDRPIIDVAKDFGICITLMKKICRRNGIKRWPHRQIRSLSKSIASMEAAMLSAQGTERDKYRDQIINLKLKRDAVIADPNKENSMMSRPKTPTKESTSLRPHAHVHTPPKLSPRDASAAHAISLDATTRSKSDPAHTQSKGGRWTSEEHAAFLHGIRLYGKDWRRVAQVVHTRSAVQTRTHAQKYLLKFAGRFPFDTEGLDGKDDHDTGSFAMETAATRGEGDSVVPTDNSTIDRFATDSELTTDGHASVSVKKSALEAMAMILNSPQFKSYRDFAPPPLQMAAPLSADSATTSPRVASDTPAISPSDETMKLADTPETATPP